VTRYIPFVLIPITLSSSLSPHPDVGSCYSLSYAIVSINVVCVVFSELTFRLRAYAMWNLSRPVLIIICCTLAASLGAVLYISVQFLSSITFGEPPLPLIYGCYMTSTSSIHFMAFVILMCDGAVITSLTLYPAYRHFRHTPNFLVQNMMRDSAFYCLSTFAMSITNVLLIFLLPVPYSRVLVTYQVVMQAILATRMQIHLRKLHQSVHLSNPLSDGSVLPMESFKPADPLYSMTHSWM